MALSAVIILEEDVSELVGSRSYTCVGCTFIVRVQCTPHSLLLSDCFPEERVNVWEFACSWACVNW